MPYSKKKVDDKWQVFNKDSDKVYGTHDSEYEADAQLAALYANANDTVKKDAVGETFNIFIPITKVDAERREVWGWGAKEQPDNSNEILDYASSKPNFEDWSQAAYKRTGGKSRGNVRSMHQPIAAGKLISFQSDDVNKGFYVGAHIVDDNEWRKVQSGVFSGFSVGGSYERRWPDMQHPGLIRYTAKPVELSIVDAPCIPDATFQLVKGEGIMDSKFQPGNGLNKVLIEVVDVLEKEDKTPPPSSAPATVPSSAEPKTEGNDNVSTTPSMPPISETVTPAPMSDVPPAPPLSDEIPPTTPLPEITPEPIVPPLATAVPPVPPVSNIDLSNKSIVMKVKCSQTFFQHFIQFLAESHLAGEVGNGHEFSFCICEDEEGLMGMGMGKYVGKLISADDLAKKKDITDIDSPEPISSTNVATPGKPALEIERMPDSNNKLEMESDLSKIPSQESLMSHAVQKKDLQDEIDELLNVMPGLVKFELEELITGTVDNAVHKALKQYAGELTALLKDTSVPAERMVRVVR